MPWEKSPTYEAASVILLWVHSILIISLDKMWFYVRWSVACWFHLKFDKACEDEFWTQNYQAISAKCKKYTKTHFECPNLKHKKIAPYLCLHIHLKSNLEFNYIVYLKKWEKLLGLKQKSAASLWPKIFLPSR